MTNKYYLANSEKMNKRRILAEEFYNSIHDPEEIPYIVTDEASLYDIYIGENLDIIPKIEMKYGIKLTTNYFKIPLPPLILSDPTR